MIDASPQPDDARESGHAMVIAMIAVVLSLSVTIGLTQLSQINVQSASSHRDTQQLESAASLGLDQAKLLLWDRFVADNGGQAGDLDAFRDHLDSDAIGIQANRTLYLDAYGMGFGRESKQKALSRYSLDGEGPTISLTVNVAVTRTDEADATYLTIVSTAEDGSGTRKGRETVLRVGAPQWEGFRFAMLGHDMSFAMHNAHVSTTERAFNMGNPAQHERTKVASLERLVLDNNANSLIAGTLYTRGPVVDPSGVVYGSLPGGASGVQAHGINADGTIDGTVREDLADGMATSTPYANYYDGYPTDKASMFDGMLPTSIPPIVAGGEDGTITDGEWLGGVASATGTIGGGALILPVPDLSPINGPLPAVGGVGLLPSGTTNQHAILVGTDLLPIQIDGDVAIDGDVIISGKIKGTGKIIARGNIFVLGDLQYADGVDGSGERTFGTASDGTTNALALMAGGNVIVGNVGLDYDRSLTVWPLPSIAMPTNDGVGFSGTNAKAIASWNRAEWAKTMPYFNPTTQQLTKLAAGAVPNVSYDSSHVPQYTTFTEGGAPSMSFDPGLTWNNAKGVWQGSLGGSELKSVFDETPWGAPTTSGASTEGTDWLRSRVLPAGGMITTSAYYLLQTTSDLTRGLVGPVVLGAPQKPYQVDGLLYSRNAVFVNSHTLSGGKGGAVINGMIVGGRVANTLSGLSQDVDGDGSNETVGLVLNYDARLRDFIDIDDSGSLSVEVYTLYSRER